MKNKYEVSIIEHDVDVSDLNDNSQINQNILHNSKRVHDLFFLVKKELEKLEYDSKNKDKLIERLSEDKQIVQGPRGPRGPPGPRGPQGPPGKDASVKDAKISCLKNIPNVLDTLNSKLENIEKLCTELNQEPDADAEVVDADASE